MLIAGFDGKGLYRLISYCHTASEVVARIGPHNLPGTCHRRDVCLLYAQVIDVILDEKGVAYPFAEQQLVICQSDDVLCQHVVGRLEGIVHFVPPVVARTVEGIVQVQQMSRA